MNREEIEKHAKVIWDYLRIADKLCKSDLIVMFGSHDPSVAEYTARLYLEGWAPLLVFSGGRGSDSEHWKELEADKYSAMAIKIGVPRNAILIENKSTNTAENIQFTKKILEEKKLSPKRIIITQKPYMGRRVLATMEKEWNDVEYIITSPPVLFEGYRIPELTREEMIGSMVGDLERLKLYGEKGFLVKQNIPDGVWEARNKIRKGGVMRRFLNI